jgi:hypothetical protein
MGEGMRKERAEHYKQKEDEVAMEELQHDDLLSARVAEAATELDCDLYEDADFPALGAAILLLDLSRERVCVFLGGAQIGWVDRSGTEFLRQTYDIDKRKSRSMPAIVTDVAELSGRFTVRL